MPNDLNLMEEGNLGNVLNIPLTESLRSKLSAAQKWGRIAAIVSFVNLGIGLLQDFKDWFFMPSGTGSNIISTAIGLVVGIYLSLFLYRFSSYIKKTLEDEDQEAFVLAASQLKSYMRMMGIILIILGVIFLLAFMVILFRAG